MTIYRILNSIDIISFLVDIFILYVIIIYVII